MRLSLILLMFAGCGGDGDGGPFDLAPRVPWSAVQVEDHTALTDPRAVSRIQAHLRRLANEARIDAGPFHTVEVVDPVPDVPSVARRRLGTMQIPADIAELGIVGATCEFMIDEAGLAELIATRHPAPGADETPLQTAIMECIELWPVTARRIRARTCEGSSNNLAHDLLFPLPPLNTDEPVELDWVDLPPPPPGAQAVGVSGGSLVRYEAAEQRVLFIDLDSGREVGSEPLPEGASFGVVAYGDVIIASDGRAALHRKVGDGDWTGFDTGIQRSRIVGDQATWWVDEQDVVRVRHDSEQVERLPMPFDEGFTLLSRAGEVWATGTSQPRRWDGEAWEPGVLPHDRWGSLPPPVFDDEWTALLESGTILRIDRTGAVSFGPGLCTGGGVGSLVTGPGEMVAVDPGGTQAARVPAPISR